MIVIWILIIGMLGVGIFALRGAIKNSFKDTQLRAKAHMLREILGAEGYRYFVGIIGGVFIAASLGLVILIVGGKSLMSGESKTDVMTIALITGDSTVTSSLMVTESQLKMKYDALGDRTFDTYQHISLRNNYRRTLPDLLWKMKNLESIDLTNNKFTELPLQELAQLPKLRRLVLDGNPIEQAYMEKIRSTLVGILVVKEDVLKP
jgi:hypothetical protein